METNETEIKNKQQTTYPSLSFHLFASFFISYSSSNNIYFELPQYVDKLNKIFVILRYLCFCTLQIRGHSSPCVVGARSPAVAHRRSPSLAVARRRSPSLAVARRRSPSLAVARRRSPSLAVARRRSPSFAVARRRSPSLAVARRRSPSLAVARRRSPSLAVACRRSPSLAVARRRSPSRNAQCLFCKGFLNLLLIR